MRVLWVGDAGVASGFAECTHQVCMALHNAGHEVHVLGINYMGDPHPYPFSIYPCRQPFDGGFDLMGQTRIKTLVRRLQPDLIVLLNDPWNIQPYLESIQSIENSLNPGLIAGGYYPKIVSWLAIDAENQKGREHLTGLDHVVCWTDFGKEQITTRSNDGGYQGPCSVIPLGVDLDIYQPVDRETARARILPQQARDQFRFIFGMVGRNQTRKRLDLAIKYFAEWTRQYDIDDAALLIHTAPTGDNGFDLQSLITYYGANGKVIISCTDNLGVGLNPHLMKYLYSAFDAYWCTSQAEGWGLPALEAMACGVPVICNDSGPIGEWTRGAALQVQAKDEVLTAPVNQLMYTIGRAPSMRQSIIALSQMYHDRALRLRLRDWGLDRASQFQWKNVTLRFVEFCREIVYNGGNGKVQQTADGELNTSSK